MPWMSDKYDKSKKKQRSFLKKTYKFSESKLLGLNQRNRPSHFISVKWHFVFVFSPYLRGSAAGPVRGPHSNVDTGRGLRVCSVSPLGGWQPRDDQATGETPFTKQKAQRGRRRRDLRGREGTSCLMLTCRRLCFSRREKTTQMCSYLTWALLMLCCLELWVDATSSRMSGDLRTPDTRILSSGKGAVCNIEME